MLTPWGENAARGQSAPLGVALVFAIMIVSTTAVVALGAGAISETKSELAAERMQKTMTEFDSQAALVALGSSGTQQVSFGSGHAGSFSVDDDAGHITVSVNGAGSPIVDTDLGAIVYEHSDGTKIAYQGGGVWRSNGDERSTMVSSPELHYREETLTLPIVTVQGSDSLSGSATVTHNNSTQHFPDQAAGDTNPLTSGRVEVTVKSDYYRAWGSYMAERTDGVVDYDHANNKATLELVIPATAPPVRGGIVASAAGNSLTIKQNAEADSYNSSDAPYGSFPNSDGSKIVVASDVDVENNAEIHGDLESGGDVTVSNNGEIFGNVSWGTSLDNDGTITGWTEQNASVSAPSDVEGLIDEKRTSFDSDNDNGDPSVDIDTSTDTMSGCDTGSGCDLTAGDYYLDELKLTDSGDKLNIDTSGGTVNIVVDGQMTLGDNNNEQIDVSGSNRVNIYLEGNLKMKNGVSNSVPGDKSTNFWIYMNPDSDASLKQGAELTGVIYGPPDGSNDGVDIQVNENVEIFGGLVGFITFNDNNFAIHYDEALTNADTLPTNSPRTPSLTYLHISTNEINVTSG